MDVPELSLNEGTGYFIFDRTGTTVSAVAEQLGLTKILLGVDALYSGKIIAADINENEILKLLTQYKSRKIIITPIGGNGFIFGRGNKQFTPEVIKQIGLENIVIISTGNKIAKLDCLRVDSGDVELDRRLSGYREVIVGDHLSRMVKVK